MGDCNLRRDYPFFSFMEDKNMVKLFELSETARKAFVSDVSGLLENKYHVDNEDIDQFWNTVIIGTTKMGIV
jgi:hypothetical protein